MAEAGRPQGRPRVLQLCEFEREQGGSFVPMLIAVSRAARERGFEPAVVFFDSVAAHPWLAEFERAGIGVHLVASEVRHSRRAMREWLERELGGGGDALLHTHFTCWDLAAAALARRRPRTRVVWHVHSALPREPLVVARTVLKFALLGRHVDAFLCPAPNIVDAVRRRGGRRERVRLMPSAVDVGFFSPPSPEQRAAARATLGLEPGELALLHFGWHTRLKGTDLFLEALGQVRERLGSSVVGLERGGGEEAMELARKLEVADGLHLLGPVDDARSLHHGADVLVQSSREEGMAYAVLESLAAGTPAVVTSIPGHALIGAEMDACRVVDVDPEAIAAGIIATLERDPETAAREAAQTRSWMVENLSTDAVGKRLAALYAELFAL